jgi:hypothetical protein
VSKRRLSKVKSKPDLGRDGRVPKRGGVGYEVPTHPGMKFVEASDGKARS